MRPAPVRALPVRDAFGGGACVRPRFLLHVPGGGAALGHEGGATNAVIGGLRWPWATHVHVGFGDSGWRPLGAVDLLSAPTLAREIEGKPTRTAGAARPRGPEAVRQPIAPATNGECHVERSSGPSLRRRAAFVAVASHSARGDRHAPGQVRGPCDHLQGPRLCLSHLDRRDCGKKRCFPLRFKRRPSPTNRSRSQARHISSRTWSSCRY